MTAALSKYIQHLASLAKTSPSLLLAHVYVRILGDLRGGQYIKRQVQKTYQLEDDAVSFYRFGSLDDTNRLKTWIRAEMNAVVSDPKLKGEQLDSVLGKCLLDSPPAELVAEARKAFVFNVAILDSLPSPSSYPSM